MADKLITVVGDVVDLYVETDETIEPAVEVDFQSVPVKTNPNQTTPPPNINFTEALTAAPSPLRDPPNAKGLFASRIKWKVNLKKDPVLEARTAVLVARVRGKSKESGRVVTAPVRDQLFVQAIDVTDAPKLTRIMLHEFAKENERTLKIDFDPKPVEDFAASLSVQQKKLLCKIAEANPSGRLVVFITFYDTAKKSLRIFADNGGGNHSIRPNASFSVFHCRDVEKGGVTLVCHTEHLAVHMLNGDTQKWILGREGPKKQLANDYMQKSNPEPVEYKIAAHLPADNNGHDGVIWCSIFRPDGNSIMPGNFIHGIVNTLGCWMLFRNYNWPRTVANEFDRVYRLARRLGRFNSPAVIAELEKITDSEGRSYNVRTPPANESDSAEKFGRFDKNFAHLYFFHEIVGIKYFSTTIGYMVKSGRRNPINERNPHGLVFENTFPFAQAGLPPAFNLPEEGSFAAYDPENRRAQDRSFKQDDSLWRENALGFKASTGFVPSFARSVTPGEIKSKSWADVFFYKDDGVDLSAASPLVQSTAAFVPRT